MVYFDCKEENKYSKCIIYLYFRDENDLEKVIFNNLYKIFCVIKRCIKCRFFYISVYFLMICSKLYRWFNIEMFLDE